ncbi:zinc-binding alcohol dehydrogenase family protein [Variovorax sp. UC122_21]|uniref:quinone oxidoreductase family protein n=1 Tax=Variovorax sp. UC122_21 TaxID=3374554 RepID=UPI003756B919
MKAVRIAQWGEPPRIEERPDPVPAPGRSLVRMQAATVGHIDRTVWRGGFLRPPPLPYTPGVEGAGIVIHSERFAPGQRVWLRGSGLGTLFDGTWCEIADAPDAALGELPEGLDMALGSAFFSPCTSAWVALHEVARVRAGERVMVTGASGAVGSLAVQLALEIGAKVCAVVADASADHGLPSGVDVVEWRSGIEAPSQEAEVLIDTVGGDVLAALLGRVLPGGRAVLIGYTAGETLSLSLPAFMQRDVSLLPLNMFRREAQGRAAVPRLLERLSDGRLRLAVQRFAFDEAARALEWIAQRGRRGRAVLVAD